jgi:hypothetical protein
MRHFQCQILFFLIVSFSHFGAYHANEYLYISLWLNEALSVSKKAISCCTLVERTLPTYISTWWTHRFGLDLLKGAPPRPTARLLASFITSSYPCCQAGGAAAVRAGGWLGAGRGGPCGPPHAHPRRSCLLCLRIDLGAGEDDVAVLIHHPECGSRTHPSAAANGAAGDDNAPPPRSRPRRACSDYLTAPGRVGRGPPPRRQRRQGVRGRTAGAADPDRRAAFRLRQPRVLAPARVAALGRACGGGGGAPSLPPSPLTPTPPFLHSFLPPAPPAHALPCRARAAVPTRVRDSSGRSPQVPARPGPARPGPLSPQNDASTEGGSGSG